MEKTLDEFAAEMLPGEKLVVDAFPPESICGGNGTIAPYIQHEDGTVTHLVPSHDLGRWRLAESRSYTSVLH